MEYSIEQLDELLKDGTCDILSIKELSVGDWLQKTILDPRHQDEQYVSIPVQVRGIFTDAAGGENVIYYDPIEKNEICALIRHFAPFPISQELVKSSGAELIEIGDNGATTPPQDRNRFEKWKITTGLKIVNLWFDRRIHKWSLTGASLIYLDYVHQLQHTLWLLGLPWSINPQETFAPWLKTLK